LRALAQDKVPALLSNSDCETTRELYRDFADSIAVPGARAINSVGTVRGPVDEMLVRSFDYPVAPRSRVATLKTGSGDRWPRRRRCGPVGMG
jgi:hypothetical protein